MNTRALLLVILAVCTAAAPAPAARQRRLLLGAETSTPRYWPSLKWRLELGMGAQCTPAAADVDLDGRVELFVPDPSGKIVCLSPEGAVRWSVPVGAPLSAGVLLGDADRDGALDLCVAAGKELICLSPDGKAQWRFQAQEKIACMPVLADLDRDDSPEVCVGSNDNRLYCIEKGKEKWQFETDSWVVSSPAVADLLGDAALEVCFGSLDGNLYCLNAAGKELWRFDTGAWVQSAPAIGDLDRDGSPEVVFASDNGSLYSLSAQGRLEWKIGLTTPEGHHTGGVALADLDGDGTLEALLGTQEGQLHCVVATGEQAWVGYCQGPITGTPIVADVNDDSYQEVLVGGEGGRVHCFNTWGRSVWGAYLGCPVTGTPLLADLDRDGKHELYAGGAPTGDNPKGYFSKYVVTTPGGAIRWASCKGDPCRTGLAGNALDYGRCLRAGTDYATAWEPFHTADRPETKLLSPRSLEIAAEAPLEDSAPGNRNGVLDAGETAVLRVAIRNRGAAPVYDTMLTLDPGESGLVADRTRAFIGRVPGGAAKLVRFYLSAPKGLKETTGLLTLKASESNVNVGFARLRVALSPPIRPLLQVSRWNIRDAGAPDARGNGNGRLDAGEQVILWTLFQNDGSVTAHGAQARLLSRTPDVLAATPVADLGTVVPGGGRQARFAVRVARKLVGRQAVLLLQTTSRGGVVRRQELRLPLGPTPLDLQPPAIALAAPRRTTASTYSDSAILQGKVTDASGIARVLLNGKPVAPTCLSPLPRGAGVWFALRKHLELGENILTLTATDRAGNSTTSSLNLVRKPK